MSSLTLQGKHAVVFGAGGSIGSAVARELASAGAKLFLAGRTAASVAETARQIGAAGGARPTPRRSTRSITLPSTRSSTRLSNGPALSTLP
jgi:NAD(P)-dependent dehydrogenase (short-subunit alcohol dehydrogenase family)